jgi:hypothetical protein
VKAIERIFEIAAQHVRLGHVYHTSPIALRFVRSTDAYLAMMEGRTTMMIELILLTRTQGGLELLAAYEDVRRPVLAARRADAGGRRGKDGGSWSCSARRDDVYGVLRLMRQLPRSATALTRQAGRRVCSWTPFHPRWRC